MAPVLMFSLAEKPLSGEPDAGNPPVRFGGRGGVEHAIPTPILVHPSGMRYEIPVALDTAVRAPGRQVQSHPSRSVRELADLKYLTFTIVLQLCFAKLCR